MYELLLKYLNKPLANLFIVLWYALLILLIIYYADTRSAEFEYLNY